MKKIIALALALIMALSMASVAFAADFFSGNTDADGKAQTLTIPNNTWTNGLKVAPGTTLNLVIDGLSNLEGYKLAADFTKGSNKGASYIESVKIAKAKNSILLTIKESTKLFDEPVVIEGCLNLTAKDSKVVTDIIGLQILVNNNVEPVYGGAKKAVDAPTIYGGANTVVVMDEDGGLVKFANGQLEGYVKMNKDEKVFFELKNTVDADTLDAIEEYLGDDYEAIVEYYNFAGKDFANDVDFYYDAYAEDPHFFYAWDGAKFVALDAKYDDDEDVEKYVWTGDAEGIIIVTDVEIVAAAEEETKNPDTGANDVVGVAAALAVVSLVAAGAVSLKK